VCVLHVMVFAAPAFSQSCSGSACQFGQDYTVGSNISTNATNLSTSGVPTSLDGIKLLICGEFNVDDDFDVSNSTIVLTEDSELIINGTYTFESVDNSFQGCDGMWKGITVEADASLDIAGSFLYDAYIGAIRALADSRVFAVDNFFDRNHISILVGEGRVNLTCASNRFRANTFSFNFPGGGNGNNNGRSWIAIDVHESFGNIGGTRGSAAFNDIEGPFEIGVRFDRSFYSVRNTDFTDLAHQQGNIWRGTGVVVNNNTIGLVNHCTFENVVTGVNFSRLSSTVRVVANIMEEYTFGVNGFVASPSLAYVTHNILGNETVSGNRGIRLYQSGGPLSSLNNEIYVDSRDGQYGATWGGIGIQHAGFFGVGPSRISDNSLQLIFGGTVVSDGIALDVQQNARVSNNDIVIASAGEPFTGLHIRSSNSTSVENNRIVADEQSSIGIRVLGSPRTTLCCNVDSLMDVAVNFAGQSGNSRFAANELHRSRVGVEIEEGGVIGRQFLTGNRWRDQFATIGAINHNNDPNQVRNSLFSVTDLNQPDGPGTFDPGNFFIRVHNSDDKPCASLAWYECGGGIVIPPHITNHDTTLASGYLDTIFDEGSLWISYQNLFSKMYENSDLYGDDPLTDDWYDNQLSTVVEDYHLKRDTIQKLFDIPTLEQDTLDEVMDSVTFYFDLLGYMDSVIASQSIGNWPGYAEDRLEIVKRLDSVYGVYMNTFNRIMDTRYAKAQDLIVTNGQLSNPDLPTRYEKLVNDIFLKTVASNVDTLTTAQVDSLYKIANACYKDAGRAVFMAASLYQVHELHHFDFEANCNISSIILNDELPNQAIRTIKVVPSPTRDYLQVIASDGEWSSVGVDYQIFDMAGRARLQGALNTLNRIDVSSLTNGIYVLRMVDTKGAIYQTKFVVQQ
jgi:hypothetical protein